MPGCGAARSAAAGKRQKEHGGSTSTSGDRSGGTGAKAVGDEYMDEAQSTSLDSPRKARDVQEVPSRRRCPDSSVGVRATGCFRYKDQVKAFYDHKWIQIFIAGLILANFATNLIEKEIDPGGNRFPGTFGVFEDFFNIVFLLELIANAYGNWFWPFLCSSWNIFDLIVVAVGCISLSFLNLPPLPGPFKLLR